jgi:hypothetical protein
LTYILRRQGVGVFRRFLSDAGSVGSALTRGNLMGVEHYTEQNMQV